MASTPDSVVERPENPENCSDDKYHYSDCPQNGNSYKESNDEKHHSKNNHVASTFFVCECRSRLSNVARHLDVRMSQYQFTFFSSRPNIFCTTRDHCGDRIVDNGARSGF